MDRENMLRNWKKMPPPVPSEEKILQTIQKSKDVYYRQEQELLLTDWEFLWSQFRYTRKRWWWIQVCLLIVACPILSAIEDIYYRVRSTGVIGCLFVVFMIPELWRNRESEATQIEASCLFSLRQVYAARITLFGIVDISLLTLFSVALEHMGFTWTEVVSQLLLPATVTACICFSLLNGKSGVSETVSIAACLTWCGIWWLILLDEKIYARIVPAVWAVLMGLAALFLALAVRAAIRTTNQYWEVEFA